MMEKGFYHPTRGYWQTTGVPPEEILAAYPEGTVEVPLKPGADHEWDGAAWIATAQPAAELLLAEREQMVCSPAQGILVLGEAVWNSVLAYRDAPDTLWQHKIIIDSAQDWRRLSQNMQFFAYLFNFTDEQMDDLFRAAMKVVL